ncbi:MAG: oligoendopeptidase F [bacterium]|nr:oligoendopeptidase F [bacterium]
MTEKKKLLLTPTRQQIPEEVTWNLSAMFPTLADWDKDFGELAGQVEDMNRYCGRLGESAAVLSEACQTFLATSQKLEKLFVYAHLKSDEDLTNSDSLGLLQRISSLATRFSTASSYFSPELIAIEPSRFEQLLADPALASYARMLREIARFKPHTLSKEEEAILAGSGEILASFRQIYSQLNNADFQFGEIELDGEKLALTHSTFVTFLKKTDAKLREEAFNSYYKVYDEHKNSLAALYTSSVKKDVFLARTKGYPSALEASLFVDDIELAVHANLIKTVSANLEPLHRYYELRKRILGLEKQSLYDTYVPLVADVHTSIPYESAVEILCQAAHPLGEEYTREMRQGLTADRWVDRQENIGKRSGAYSSGCYGTHPYILLNYKKDDLNDLFTLAHEAGHSMHSLYSRRHQTYQDHDYVIFVAEVASTLNEELLLDHLRRIYSDDKRMLLYLLNHQLDDIKAIFFRQTMFAEFEMIIHELAEAHEPLTIDRYRSIYRGLLEKYFGPAVEIPPLGDLECLRIPHFYSAFYVYKYATGLSAAVSLSEDILAGNLVQRDKYLDFLKSGRSKYPLTLLADAGVDLRKPLAVERTIELFANLLTQLEENL